MECSPGGQAVMCLNLNAAVTGDQARVEGLASSESEISENPTSRILAHIIRKSP